MITVKTAGVEQYMEGGEGRLKFLLAGGAGTGKTRFTGFAPRPIIAACEEGILSVADLSTPYATVKGEEDMNAFLTLLEQECKKPKAQRRWDTVGIDTIDAYERDLIANYMRKHRMTEFEGWDAWGYLAGTMNNLLARLFALDMNIIMLVHTKAVTRDGQVPKDQLVLRLKGDVGQQLPNDFDFVGLIETTWVAGDDGQDVVRRIRWKSTPAAPWLKFRGQGVRDTPLDFAPSDFEAIRAAITAGAKNATASEVIETVEAPADVTPPQAPSPGVAAPVAKRATPAKAPAQPPAKAPARPVPPVPAAAAPVPAAPKPDLSAPVATAEEAVANVQAVLPGSTVVSDSAGQIPSEPATIPVSQETVQSVVVEPEVQAEEQATTPVAEPDVPADPPTEQADTEQATAEESAGFPVIPDDGTIEVQCGTPRFTNTAPKGTVPGCGKELTITVEDRRITAAGPSPENAQFIEMASLKERAVLCNACFREARVAATAAAQ
jgi:hypothetical protein